MSVRDCISVKGAIGRADPERARRAAELFDGLEAELRGRHGASEARRLAGAETVAILKREAIEKKRQTLLQIQAWQRIERDVTGYRNGRGEEDLPAALTALLDADDRAAYSNVSARQKAIRGRLHSRFEKVLERFRRTVTGQVRHKADLANMVREAFGQDTGDVAAKELAKAWAETAEFARLKFNAAGGRIPKRADWGLPQIHDTLRVRKETFEGWRNFTLSRLDPARMIDEATGRPIAAGQLELALRDVYETIRTDGFAKMKPSAAAGGRSLANRRLDHRFLVFRNADAWLEYQTRFGGGDPFSTMVSHLDAMAGDIALMEILGPNPSATLRRLGQVVEKRAAERDARAGTTAQLDRARGAVRTADEMFAHLTGAAHTPISGRAARSFAGLRSVLQSAQLGAAALSAISDLGFQRIASKMAGLPQAAELGRFVKMLVPGSLEDQRLAVRLGLIAENWSTLASAQARYTGEVTGPEIGRRLSDFVMRASYLSHWTQAGRWAFGMEFMGTLADHAGQAFEALPPALQKTMARYGLKAGAWDVLRKTALYEHEGARFLRPDDVGARADLAPGRADELATRLLEMIQTETEYAVPSTSLRGRVALVGEAPPGTVQGELLRSFAMYKNFAVTLAATHVRRGLTQPGLLGKGRYFADLVISTSVLGALALQMKEIAKGRDPRPMVGGKASEFWMAAMVQGGGLGIFGDFLFSDVNRFDRGLAETVAGPVVGFFNDVRRLTLGNLAQLPGEDPTNFGREFTGFLRRYTPGGSLWYARLAYERLILDQLQQLADPKAGRSFRARERRYARDFNQGYFWRPGALAPRRGPDLGRAMKE